MILHKYMIMNNIKLTSNVMLLLLTESPKTLKIETLQNFHFHKMTARLAVWL